MSIFGFAISCCTLQWISVCWLNKFSCSTLNSLSCSLCRDYHQIYNTTDKEFNSAGMLYLKHGFYIMVYIFYGQAHYPLWFIFSTDRETVQTVFQSSWIQQYLTKLYNLYLAQCYLVQGSWNNFLPAPNLILFFFLSPFFLLYCAFDLSRVQFNVFSIYLKPPWR